MAQAHAADRHAGHGQEKTDGYAHVHAHAHAHGHAARSASNQRRLLVVIVFGLVILAVEVVGGLLANSLVLLSDAVHMSTDIAALGLAYVAIRIAERPPSASKSYGYQRAEIVAAFLNAIFLWALAAYFIYEGWQRLLDPPDVIGPIVLWVGLVGLLANIAMAIILHRGSGHNLNVRSAYLHVISDGLGSVAAVVAGLGVTLYGAKWLDPAATLVVSALILLWTFRLTRETLHVLLEGTPASVDPAKVREIIAGMDGVLDVHDLHVWSLTTGVNNLSAHVTVTDPAQGPQLVRALRQRLKAQFELSHVTIEVDVDETDCIGCN